MKVSVGNILAIALSLFAAPMLAGPAFADGQTLRIGTEGTWKPFSYQDAAGNLIGFEVELVRAACEKAQITCELVVIPFDNLIPSLQEGKIDAAASGFRASAKRKKVVDFVHPYYRFYPIFASCSHKDLKDTSPAGLRGLSVGSQIGTSSADYIKARYPEIDLRTYKNVDDIWSDMKSGRLDLAFANQTTALDFLNSENGQGCALIGDAVTDRDYFADPMAIAIRKDDKATKEVLDRGVTAILEDGTFDKLNSKYWPFSIKYTGEGN